MSRPRGVVLPLMLLWLVGFTLLAHGAWVATEARVTARRMEDQATQARRLGRHLLRGAIAEAGQGAASDLALALPGLRLQVDAVALSDHLTQRDAWIEYGAARLQVRALVEHFNPRSWLASTAGWLLLGQAPGPVDPGRIALGEPGACTEPPSLAVQPVVASDAARFNPQLLPATLQAHLDTIASLEGGMGVRVARGSVRLGRDQRFEGWLWVEHDLTLEPGSILRGAAHVGGLLTLGEGARIEVAPCAALTALESLAAGAGTGLIAGTGGFVP